MTDPSLLYSGFAPASYEDWRRAAEKALKGEPFEALIARTRDGIAVGPIYPPRAHATPVTTRQGAWGVVQRIDLPDPEAANAQALEDLENGASGLSVAFEGAPAAYGFGVRCGEAALSRILDGVLVAHIALRIEPCPQAGEISHWLRRVLDERQIAPVDADISFGLDPIGLGAVQCIPIDDWPRQQAALFDTIGALSQAGFVSPMIEADGRIWHDLGATTAQELGAVLATARAYRRALGDAAPVIGLSVSADHRQFETIAKLRALRRLWTRLHAHLGTEAAPVRIHAETSYPMMMAQDPQTNSIRTTISAFSAGIAGADSVAVLPYTIAHGLPAAPARRLARNTQLLLLEEANLFRVADPAAGAGGVEALTEAIADAAWRNFEEIESEGGIIESLRAGKLRSRIGQSERARARAMEAGELPFVGSTIYPPTQPAPVEVLRRREAPASRQPE